ncbi:MAG: branched-chain amino acid transport system ATP-binding protein [Flavobacteriaceae bacterium]|jgi:branched-chain amino acid transport system ATP-binding protein|tara:strand:- start:89 stop:793 length:705 start_codon:yes stop_codon:yes gene_type:complete
MLEVKNLTAGYGDIVAVRDLTFSLQAGKILALMGANGAGKSTTLMALFGLVDRKLGSIIMNGEDISAIKVEDRISKGLAIVPEGRRLFPDLTVSENLVVGGHIAKTAKMSAVIDMVYEYFPRLAERRAQLAGSLSGGEQQMLAMGRALISEPSILVVDELSLGLMPKVVDECYVVLEKLKAENIGVLLVEQNTERVFSAADDVIVLEAGNVIWSGSAINAKENPSLRKSLMGLN